MGCGSAVPCGRRLSRTMPGSRRPRAAGRPGPERDRDPEAVTAASASFSPRGPRFTGGSGLSPRGAPAALRSLPGSRDLPSPGPAALPRGDVCGAARGARRGPPHLPFLLRLQEERGAEGAFLGSFCEGPGLHIFLVGTEMHRDLPEFKYTLLC